MKTNVERVIYSKYYMKADSLQIIGIDEQFTRMLGYTMEDIREHQYILYDLIPEEDLAEYETRLNAQFNAKGRAYLWHRMRCKDGSNIFVFCFGEIYIEPQTGEKQLTCLITDTTSIKNLKKEVSEKSVLLEGILDNMAGGAALFDVRTMEDIREIRCTYGSRNLLEEYAFNDIFEQFIPLEQFLDKYLSEQDVKRDTLSKSLLDGKEFSCECRLKRKDSTYTWMAMRITPIELESEFDGYMVLLLDITNRKNTELALQFQNEILKLCVEEDKEKIFDYNLEQDRFVISQMKDGELSEILCTENFSEKSKENNWVHHDDMQLARESFERLMRAHDTLNLELRIVDEYGKYMWVRCYCASIEDSNQKVYRIVGKGCDITDEMLQKQELKQRAERDSLTGIYNHAAMMKYIAVNVSKELEGNCAFLIIDVDNFKLINDAWGHEKGDKILTLVGRTLRSYVQGRGLAGRIGGDEFMVFLYHVADRRDVEFHMSQLCDLMERVTDKVQLTVSIGAGISQRILLDINRLYKEADQALYAAKRKGGNTSLVFDRRQLDEELKRYAEGGVYVAEEDLVLNETADGVYIMDLETHEMIYMNEALYQAVRRRKGDFDWEGRPCYEVLYDRRHPCDFCNARQLKKHESLYWQRRNELNNHQYVCKDTLINWKGRKARMEIVYDVTTPADMLNVLEKSLASNDTFRQCVEQVTDSRAFRNSYQKLLRFAGKYYSAERSCIFEEEDDGAVSYKEWNNEHVEMEQFEELEPRSKRLFETLKTHANRQGLVIFDHIIQYEQSEPRLFRGLTKDKIWTLYAIMLKKGDAIIGALVIINPKQHVGDMLLLTTLSAFVSNEMVRQKIWEKQEYELTHDPQTDVYNRSYYMNRVAALMDATSVGLATVDINNLGLINNDFGMEYGNRMIVEVANILKKAFGAENVYRFHSDEFMLLCVDIERDEFAKCVEKARTMFSTHEAGACIGYVWDDFDMDIRKMTEHAEEMLRLEKQRFHESNNADPKYRQQEIITDLKQKMKSGYFQVYLQPKICMTDKSYYGAEALIRVIDPEKGMIPPVRFIPLLEKTGTIEYIDFFVFEEVCKLLNKWQEEGIPLIPISFNFSRLTLLGENLIQRVEEIVSKYNIPKSALEVEITETIGDLEYDMIARIASGLRRAGYRLSMDDFGTKYSSISTLSIMQFDILKIDRSMVNTLETNEMSRKIMNHVIAMCQDLGIECIAEGVETEQQAELLQMMECAIAQGYLYGKPMPIEEFADKYKASLKEKQKE